jgi:nucleoside-diphosphate-sugar epimerase
MRIFVTGATGAIGFAVVKELLTAGHQVIGLARSDASGEKLRKVGAQVKIGAIENMDILGQAASASDGVIHTAFYHQISHMPFGTRLRVFLGGAPNQIVERFMRAAVNADRLAIEMFGNTLAGSNRPLVVPFASLALRQGQLATEDQSYDPMFYAAARARTEDTLAGFASRDVRTSAIRLPPTVHSAERAGLATMLMEIAGKKKESAYLGDGKNHWPSVHRDDAARLFRLALEKGEAGGTYHAIAEQGIPFRDIAQAIGERMNVPVVGKSEKLAAKHFGFLAPFIGVDNLVSSARTRVVLGWEPTHRSLFADLKQGAVIDGR